ncbi:ribonuclease HII [Microterricola pindariensis]|uniref:Ribonuclease n=1 Tax=Microterricola pindariensis TaxID=478010 RepID=A0ABX5ATA4_9MICO|nr:ribonuclease HII [Microterricola pindariensis]PPL16513.1 ribonuclease HII [Microterricola pindariensis]
MAVQLPTLELESELFARDVRFVIGCDEVGRGAMAGPVSVGMAVIDAQSGTFPDGLRDSKLLSEKRREALAPLAAAWVLHSAVGEASAAEVDEFGITACLGLAGKRALLALHESGADVAASVVLLDGSQDWLNPALASPLRVQTRVKADRDCASVAAASVIAKVHRDRQMIAAHDAHPAYGWEGNKGYGSPAHMAAIAEYGATPLHRVSWIKSEAR